MTGMRSWSHDSCLHGLVVNTVKVYVTFSGSSSVGWCHVSHSPANWWHQRSHQLNVATEAQVHVFHDLRGWTHRDGSVIAELDEVGLLFALRKLLPLVESIHRDHATLPIDLPRLQCILRNAPLFLPSDDLCEAFIIHIYMAYQSLKRGLLAHLS